jgi:hypothetical protein
MWNQPLGNCSRIFGTKLRLEFLEYELSFYSLQGWTPTVNGFPFDVGLGGSAPCTTSSETGQALGRIQLSVLIVFRREGEREFIMTQYEVLA